MASRYRNDYIRGIANTGTLPSNQLLVNKTSEESRARFGNIMNSLVQKHEEEKETYVPAPVTVEPVQVRETYFPQKSDDQLLQRDRISFRGEQKKDKEKLAVIVVVIVICIMLVMLYKMLESQKVIDNLIREEVYRSRQLPF